MRHLRIDTSDRSRGYAEVTDVADNGSWVDLEVVEYTRSGYARTKTTVRMNIFSAACVAGKIAEAVERQAAYVDRMRRIVRREGY